jgi:hypothetical protein
LRELRAKASARESIFHYFERERRILLSNGVPIVSMSAIPTIDGKRVYANYSGKSSGPYDVIVIGSGMGGMACATALAKQGRKVLVLEQHYVPGGFTHMYARKGFVWDAGVHAIGEMLPNEVPGKATVDEVMTIGREGMLPILRKMAGFLSYDLVPSSDGKTIVSISRWRTMDAAEQGRRASEAFVRDKAASMVAVISSWVGPAMVSSSPRETARVSSPSYPS